MKTWHAGARLEAVGLSLALFKQDKLEGGPTEVLRLSFDTVAEDRPIETPTFTRQEQDVRDFLQACLNCAWALGLRPDTSDNASVYDQVRKSWLSAP